MWCRGHNYDLWPWVGRASEPLQNQGVQQTVSGEVFSQGIVRARPSPILDVGSGASLRFKREELLKAA